MSRTMVRTILRRRQQAMVLFITINCTGIMRKLFTPENI